MKRTLHCLSNWSFTLTQKILFLTALTGIVLVLCIGALRSIVLSPATNKWIYFISSDQDLNFKIFKWIHEYNYHKTTGKPFSTVLENSPAKTSLFHRNSTDTLSGINPTTTIYPTEDQLPRKALRFNKDKKFKIVQFTDTHFTDDFFDEERTLLVQEAIVKEEKPDLIVLSGDAISGDVQQVFNEDRKQFASMVWKKYVTRISTKYNIPHAYINGNHDTAGQANALEIAQIDMEYKLSFTNISMVKNHPESTTNYKIPIYDTNGERVLFYVYMFDSERNHCMVSYQSDEKAESTRGGCVRREVVEMYLKESLKEPKNTKKGVAFVHIPLNEFKDLVRSNITRGLFNEKIISQSSNTGLFAAIEEAKNVRAVFSGHDHKNDFFGEYNGILMGYGRKTGYGGYGTSFGTLSGARVIQFEIEEKGDVDMKTWIRTESGGREETENAHINDPYWFNTFEIDLFNFERDIMGILMVVFATLGFLAGISTFLSLVIFYRKRKSFGTVI